MYSNFGATEESNLGPVPFNLCLEDMKDCLPSCACLQYIDDSTIYQHCRVKDLKTCCNNIEKDASRLLNCSTNNNLVFNVTKKNNVTNHGSNESWLYKLNEIKDLEIKCMVTQLDLVN